MKKYSYIKYPYSPRGWYSFYTGVGTLLMTAGVAVRMMVTRGNVGTFEAAIGICCIVLSMTGLGFALGSLREKDVNRKFAAVGGAACALVLTAWSFVLLEGLGGITL